MDSENPLIRKLAMDYTFLIAHSLPNTNAWASNASYCSTRADSSSIQAET